MPEGEDVGRGWSERGVGFGFDGCEFGESGGLGVGR